MKAKFKIKSFLSENRDVVISKYNELKNEKFFDGINLASFMLNVMNLMIINRYKSEKTALNNLPFILGQVYMNHSTADVINDLDAKFEAKNIAFKTIL